MAITTARVKKKANRPSLNITCGHCGKTFDEFFSVVERSKGVLFCGRKCYLSYWGNPEKHLLEARIIIPETGCWESNLEPSSLYGRIVIKRRRISVHRLAAHIFLGLDLNSDVWVLHKCDNKRCFNPDHLFLGHPQDNSTDMVNKGRSARGQRNSQSRLTAEDVINIKKSAAAGESGKSLAARYGVTPTAICHILRGRNWGHIKI